MKVTRIGIMYEQFNTKTMRVGNCEVDLEGESIDNLTDERLTRATMQYLQEYVDGGGLFPFGLGSNRDDPT